MALVIDPTFSPALSARADKYLNLAQGLYTDGKPSRQFFELAIKDYSAAFVTGDKHLHTIVLQPRAYASVDRPVSSCGGRLRAGNVKC
jgi:hypothetical protein